MKEEVAGYLGDGHLFWSHFGCVADPKLVSVSEKDRKVAVVKDSLQPEYVRLIRRGESGKAPTPGRMYDVEPGSRPETREFKECF